MKPKFLDGASMEILILYMVSFICFELSDTDVHWRSVSALLLGWLCSVVGFALWIRSMFFRGKRS
jgi:hypothetical protein